MALKDIAFKKYEREREILDVCNDVISEVPKRVISVNTELAFNKIDQPEPEAPTPLHNHVH